MKNIKVVLVSFLTVGLIFLGETYHVSANEINSNGIETIITDIDGVIIEESLVPSELVDQWKEENHWQDEILDTEESFELSTVNPIHNMPPTGEITIFGPSIPSSTRNISSNGKYSYSGSFSAYNALYSNFAFVGLTKYRLYTVNTGSVPISFQAKTRFSTFVDRDIRPGIHHFSTVTTNSTSQSFYLKFSGIGGGSSVRGYVEQ